MASAWLLCVKRLPPLWRGQTPPRVGAPGRAESNITGGVPDACALPSIPVLCFISIHVLLSLSHTHPFVLSLFRSFALSLSRSLSRARSLSLSLSLSRSLSFFLSLSLSFSLFFFVSLSLVVSLSLSLSPSFCLSSSESLSKCLALRLAPGLAGPQLLSGSVAGLGPWPALWLRTTGP